MKIKVHEREGVALALYNLCYFICNNIDNYSIYKDGKHTTSFYNLVGLYSSTEIKEITECLYEIVKRKDDMDITIVDSLPNLERLKIITTSGTLQIIMSKAFLKCLLKLSLGPLSIREQSLLKNPVIAGVPLSYSSEINNLEVNSQLWSVGLEQFKLVWFYLYDVITSFELLGVKAVTDAFRKSNTLPVFFNGMSIYDITKLSDVYEEYEKFSSDVSTEFMNQDKLLTGFVSLESLMTGFQSTTSNAIKGTAKSIFKTGFSKALSSFVKTDGGKHFIKDKYLLILNEITRNYFGIAIDIKCKEEIDKIIKAHGFSTYDGFNNYVNEIRYNTTISIDYPYNACLTIDADVFIQERKSITDLFNLIKGSFPAFFTSAIMLSNSITMYGLLSTIEVEHFFCEN